MQGYNTYLFVCLDLEWGDLSNVIFLSVSFPWMLPTQPPSNGKKREAKEKFCFKFWFIASEGKVCKDLDQYYGVL